MAAGTFVLTVARASPSFQDGAWEGGGSSQERRMTEPIVHGLCAASSGVDQ